MGASAEKNKIEELRDLVDFIAEREFGECPDDPEDREPFGYFESHIDEEGYITMDVAECYLIYGDTLDESFWYFNEEQNGWVHVVDGEETGGAVLECEPEYCYKKYMREILNWEKEYCEIYARVYRENKVPFQEGFEEFYRWILEEIDKDEKGFLPHCA